MIVWLSLVENKPALLRTLSGDLHASKVGISYNGGNAGTHCVPENDQ